MKIGSIAVVLAASLLLAGCSGGVTKSAVATPKPSSAAPQPVDPNAPLSSETSLTMNDVVLTISEFCSKMPAAATDPVRWHPVKPGQVQLDSALSGSSSIRIDYSGGEEDTSVSAPADLGSGIDTLKKWGCEFLPASPKNEASGTYENPAPLGTKVTFSTNLGPVWIASIDSANLKAAAFLNSFPQRLAPVSETGTSATVTVTAKYLGAGKAETNEISVLNVCPGGASSRASGSKGTGTDFKPDFYLQGPVAKGKSVSGILAVGAVQKINLENCTWELTYLNQAFYYLPK